MDIKKLELAKDLLESIAARMIGGTGTELSNQETELVYEALNDYVVRNDVPDLSVKLPFEIELSLGEVS